MDTQTLSLTHSPFVPVATGFFGLGADYFVWGGQALFGFPKSNTTAVHLALGGVV